MNTSYELFSQADEVVVINPQIVHYKKTGIVDQVLGNAVIVKINGVNYAFQPDELRFSKDELQKRFDAYKQEQMNKAKQVNKIEKSKKTIEETEEIKIKVQQFPKPIVKEMPVVKEETEEKVVPPNPKIIVPKF